MSVNQEAASKKLLAATKTLLNVRDTSTIVEDLSSLSSNTLYIAKGVFDAALNFSKKREEEERERAAELERVIADEDQKVFDALRPLASYRHLTDAGLKNLVKMMRESHSANNKSKKAKTVKPRTPKKPPTQTVQQTTQHTIDDESLKPAENQEPQPQTNNTYNSSSY